MARAHASIRPEEPDTGSPPEAALDTVASLVRRIRRATEDGMNSLWSEAELCLREISGCSIELLVNAAGIWCNWRDLETPTRCAGKGSGAVPQSVGGVHTGSGDVFLAIREGSIVARLVRPRPNPVDRRMLDLLAQAIDMEFTICDSRDRLVRSTGELDVMRSLATHILQTDDLDELLSLVTHETKRLLASDICGVMMRDGNEVAMQSCVGQFSSETSKLRMEAGVGVAGNVLATGEPCVVPNYVESDRITRDFVPLARVEKVRSALAVPIMSRNAIIGVLEVWRRRPSNFSENDTNLLLSLAGLAAVAIDNAKLNRSRERSASELRLAHQELAERYRTISQVAAFQDEVTRLLLEDLPQPLPSIAARTSQFTAGSILILSREMALEASELAEGVDGAALQKAVAAAIGKGSAASKEALEGDIGDRPFLAQPIGAWSERMGWIVWIGDGKPAEVTRLALGHVALTTSLHLLERRRIGRERSKTLEAVLWDLLEGSQPIRAAAVDRAHELSIHIKGDCRIILISFKELASRKGEKQESALHDEVVDQIRVSELGRAAHLIGMRGEQARLICKAGDLRKLLASLTVLVEKLQHSFPTLHATAGVSGVNHDPYDLPLSLREAGVALEVARYRNCKMPACYEELGVLGLLIDLRDKADLRRIVNQILGGLGKESHQSRQVLIETLRAYFQSNCSQADTAKLLRVHQKTIAYRLAKLSRLTGLNLSRHQDRLLADMATKLMALVEKQPGEQAQ